MEFGRLRTLIHVAELGSLLPSPRHGLRTIVERYASDAQITVDVAVEANSYATLKDLVRNGHGWIILPLAAIHESVVANVLTAAPLIDPVPVRRLVLSFPADGQTPRLARFAGKAIVDIVADQVERGVWVGQLKRRPAIEFRDICTIDNVIVGRADCRDNRPPFKRARS